MLKTVVLTAVIFGSLNAVAAPYSWGIISESQDPIQYHSAEEVLLSNLDGGQGTWEDRDSRCAFGVDNEQVPGKLVVYFDFGMGVTWTIFPDTLLDFNEGANTLNLKIDRGFGEFAQLKFDPKSKKVMTYTFVRRSEFGQPPVNQTCILKD